MSRRAEDEQAMAASRSRVRVAGTFVLRVRRSRQRRADRLVGGAGALAFSRAFFFRRRSFFHRIGGLEPRPIVANL
jgi:hypothetical protein